MVYYSYVTALITSMVTPKDSVTLARSMLSQSAKWDVEINPAHRCPPLSKNLETPWGSERATLSFLKLSHSFPTINWGLKVFSPLLASSCSLLSKATSHSSLIGFEHSLYCWKVLAKEKTFLFYFIKNNESKPQLL